MQCNALPRSLAVPDRKRSVSDNVQFHSCPGRQSRTQVPVSASIEGLWRLNQLRGACSQAAQRLPCRAQWKGQNIC